MLRRNREIVIFNLSAIDLFCSGMGAVMVLMVLLLPYYGKKSPTQPQPQPQPQSTTATAEPALRFKGVDLVFVMDATASMDLELASVLAGMTSITKVLRRLSNDVRMGFVAYIDRGVTTTVPLLPIDRSSRGEANLRTLLNAIARLELVGNDTWPEDVHAGLQTATRMAWPAEQGRRQLIVLIGDADTHHPDRQASLQILSAWPAAAHEERALHAVFTPPVASENNAAYRAQGAGSEPFFRDAAAAGNGRFHIGQQDLLDNILDILIVH